jgi:hypothetical protein
VRSIALNLFEIKFKTSEEVVQRVLHQPQPKPWMCENGAGAHLITV